MSKTSTKLKKFFNQKIKDILSEKYPDEGKDPLKEDKYEELFLRLLHENDELLAWENAAAYGDSLDSHLTFQSSSQIEHLHQKVDKFLGKIKKNDQT